MGTTERTYGPPTGGQGPQGPWEVAAYALLAIAVAAMAVWVLSGVGQ